MHKLKGRLITTHLTKDNIKVTKEALIDCIKQINESNKIFPVNINHESTRQIGFVVPGSAQLIKLDDGEYAVKVEINIYENQEEKLKHFVDVQQKEEIVELTELDIHCTKIDDTNCYTYRLPKSIFEILKIAPSINKDQLLILKNPQHLFQKGILINEKFILNFHNFLRRSFSEPNSYNKRLIDKLRDIKVRNPNLELSFLVTPNSISLKSEFQEEFEFDYAWGPKIPKNLNSLKEGVTQHIASERDKSLENFDKTDFWWHTYNNALMTLEIEETRDKKIYLMQSESEIRYFPLRYAHLQYDKNSKSIIHLDCALRIYSENNFDERTKKNDISKVSKNDSDRVKLFRIDGNINAKDAFDIISLFFYNNSDVRKYFDLEEPPDS